MRRLAGLAVVAAIFGAVTVAYAANTYTTSGSVSPKKSGTASAPKAITLKFGFRVGTTDNTRPSVIVRYKIGFEGIKNFAKYFPKCKFSQISGQAPPPASCKKALVGGGTIDNRAGPANDPTAMIPCKVALTLYNLGNALGLRIDRKQAADCPLDVHGAIEAKELKIPGGDAIQFDVPSNLQEPAPGVNNAVINSTSTVKKLTKKVRIGGKLRTVGYFSSVKCPKTKKRKIIVTYTDTTGASTHSESSTPCS